MYKSRLIMGIASVAMAAGLVAYAAEQTTVQHSAQHQALQHGQRTSHDAVPDHAAMHSECLAGDATTAGKSHVPEHFAQALGLTAAQQTDIDRLSSELCQAINKAHTAMLNVLTPEQREKIAKLHGGSGHTAADIHALMMQVHGRSGGK
jgi:hypothetical protein